MLYKVIINKIIAEDFDTLLNWNIKMNKLLNYTKRNYERTMRTIPLILGLI